MTEIMAPAGSFETLAAAIKAGANSTYFGVGKLDMRSRGATGFCKSDIAKVAAICKKNNVNSYLTVNSVIYDNDIIEMHKTCDAAKKYGITAIIAHDLAVLQYAKKIGLRVHMSTQANISNIEAVRFYSKFAEVIVLARELDIDQIKKICQAIKKEKIRGPSNKLIQIEVFVHGALCIAISGKCYMSLAQYNHSANRGDCLHACRRSYLVEDDETGDKLKIKNRFIMSPADLCTIGMLDKLVNAGVAVFKIEGRARKADYVYTVVKTYNNAVKSIQNKTFSKAKVQRWRKQLSSVYNRGFWKGGYYLGRKAGEWSGEYGSKATTTKTYIGKVLNYYAKKGIALMHLEAASVKKGDDILITGPTTGAVYVQAQEIWVDDKPSKLAKKNSQITVQSTEKLRKNDKVFVIREKKET